MGDLTSSLAREFADLGEYFAISYFDEEGDSIKVTSDPEFEEALNYAKKSEFFLPILVSKEEAPAPEPQEEVSAGAPVEEEDKEIPAPFNPEDFFKVIQEAAGSNPFFEALSAGGVSDDIEQAAQNFLPMFAPLLQNLGGDFLGPFWAPQPPAPEPAAPAPAPKEEEQPREHKIEIEIDIPEVQGSAEIVVHAAICDRCDSTIKGIRYKCLICPDYDLCESCEALNLEKGVHNASHVFAKIRDPSQRHCPVFNQQGRLFRHGCRGKFGARQRVTKLENDVAALQQQEQQEQQQEISEINVVIEDVPEEEMNDDISVNIQPMVEEPSQEEIQEEEEPDQATEQLMELLYSMGFSDRENNLAALAAHDGNIEQALESLLNGSF